MSLPYRLARPANEDALLRSLAQLYEHAPGAVLIAADDGKTPPILTIRHVNEALAALSGYAPAELVGRPVAWLEADGSGVLEGVIGTALSARRPAQGEIAMRRKTAPPRDDRDRPAPRRASRRYLQPGRHGARPFHPTHGGARMPAGSSTAARRGRQY
jgi:PAS domain S-box-containing protein